MIFKQPYYVSPHAVKRFRERVANLPTKTVRTIIQAALQDTGQVVQIQNYNRRQCPVFRARYLDKIYFIPVIHEGTKKNAWPVVPTILLPGMRVNQILYERRGWRWKY